MAYYSIELGFESVECVLLFALLLSARNLPEILRQEYPSTASKLHATLESSQEAAKAEGSADSCLTR